MCMKTGSYAVTFPPHKKSLSPLYHDAIMGGATAGGRLPHKAGPGRARPVAGRRTKHHIARSSKVPVRRRAMGLWNRFGFSEMVASKCG